MSQGSGRPNDLSTLVRTKRRNNRHRTIGDLQRRLYFLDDSDSRSVRPSPSPLSLPQRCLVGSPYANKSTSHNQHQALTANPQASTNQALTPSKSTSSTSPTSTSPTSTTHHPRPLNNRPTTTTTIKPNPPTSSPDSNSPHPTASKKTNPPRSPKDQTKPPSPSPSSPLTEIDLRCPTDDLDYDFIDKAEATHSARNAQPDRADKYSGPGPESAQGVDGQRKQAAGRWGRGWFF